MNWEHIEQLAGIVDEHAVSEISVSRDGSRITLRKAHVARAAGPDSPKAPQEVRPTPSEAVEMQQPEATDEAAGEAILVRSRLVGVFHHARQPVRYAATVAAGQVVGNIEAMKLMNEVTAETGGRVVEVMIEDGAPVEYGQPLFRLTP